MIVTKTFNVDLIVQIKKPSDYVAQSAKNDEITIKLSNLEVNTTSSGTVLQTSTATKISYDVFLRDNDDNGSNYSNYTAVDKDINASGVNLSGVTIGNTLDFWQLIKTVEANVTASYTNALDFGADDNISTSDWTNVSDLVVALVDNGKLQKIASSKPTLWPNVTLTSIGEKVSGTGKAILNLTSALSRSADTRVGASSTAANSAPAVAIYPATTNEDSNATGHVNAVGTTTTLSPLDWTTATELNGSTIVLNANWPGDTNYNAGNADKSFDFTTADLADTVEKNVSVTLSETDANSLLTIGSYVSTSGVNNTGKFKVTVDTNRTTVPSTAGAITGILKLSATDEFGSSTSVDKNITFRLNRAPSFDFNSSVTLGTAYTAPIIVKFADNGTSDGVALKELNVSSTGIALTTSNVSYTIQDMNVTDLDGDDIMRASNASQNAGTNGSVYFSSVAALNADGTVNSTSTTAVNYNNGTNPYTTTLTIANNGDVLAVSANSGKLIGYITMSNDTAASDKFKWTFSANQTSGLTATQALSNNFTTGLFKVTLTAKDSYDMNQSKDLFIKFTK